ncbi:TniB family NTP-binding protein [Vibrio cholerae]|uniref:TniB family NTP-binding protein n=1 Tax=Vibrio mimicus TaxID=674 RepID=UPI001CA30AA3|nr:TniB family NTP-binding protein [Vibrio mimicus]EHP5029872.1 TniB family NTP-binding protein [Vibrio cholerae]EKF9831591.1 TniB family NTP-binding protein [Vibrio cholerae]GHW43380.1 transposase [Vibrio cholerae]HDI3233628.1 TniB family NTP-binding protein [Vibrio cholerae]HDI3271063.1 TniB family NTP-binding protein [Vibrio cholerae]
MIYTPEQLKNMASIRSLVINHPQFDHAYQAIVNAYQMKALINSAQNIICVGQSGTGKSTLKEKMRFSFPEVETCEKKIIPILVVDTPSVPTVKNIAEEMLIQLGDPRFNKGSAIEKTNRILNYLDKCEVQMVIFDELQHFVDQGKRRTPLEVSDWLKTVIDKAGVSTVLMGLERSEAILEVNEQLRRRFSRRVDIPPFSIRTKESRATFLGVIRVLDEKVDLPVRINLQDKELILSLFFASNGIIDYLVKLFIGAYEQAIKLDYDKLDKECFYIAFTECIWAEGIGNLNPFHEGFKYEHLDKPGMPFHRVISNESKRVRA